MRISDWSSDVCSSDLTSLEFRSYAAAVGRELQRIGFTEQSGTNTQYVASVNYRRAVRNPLRDGGSPVSVGVGGSTGSYGSGLGLGIGINLSGKPKAIVKIGRASCRERGCQYV